MAKIYKRSVMIYGSLQAEFMETQHNGHSIGMEYLSLVTLLFMNFNRLTMIIKYFGGCKI